MHEPHGATEDQHEAGRFAIRLKGHLAARWAGRFDGLCLSHASDGTTILAGPVVDQAALHGVLGKVRDLGLPFVSVLQVDPTQATGPEVTANTDHHRSHKETDR